MALLSNDDGLIARTPDDAYAAEQMGYVNCQGKHKNNPNCNFWINPEAQDWIGSKGGYYTCPRCNNTKNLIYPLPWTRPQEHEELPDYNFDSPSGLLKTDIGQMGEDICSKLDGLPGYGSWEWFHQGGASAASPLDAMLGDWGVEIKTLLYDAIHHRFIPGGDRPRDGEAYLEKDAKNKAAAEAGKKGVLGVLVLLDMRRSVADIYVKEMPLGPWLDSQGKTRSGVVAYRTNTGVHLLEEVPFHNPYMDPNHPAPHGDEMPATPPSYADDPFLGNT